MVELLIETSNREKNNEKSKYAIEKKQKDNTLGNLIIGQSGI